MSIDFSEIGQRLRNRRHALGWSVKKLSEHSGLSQRYILSAEHGRANLSLQKVACLVEALDIPISALFVQPHLIPFMELLEPCPVQLVSELLPWMKERILTSGRSKKVALLGVRGAGKSTVGRLLSEMMNFTFIELDYEIEKAADISLSEIFGWHGEAYYRKLERRVLSAVCETADPMVIATGGGIVNDAETFAYLKAHTITVWLEASAEHHWERVVEQGDERPMRNHPHAMAELRSLLASRAPLYREADHALNTESLGPKAVARILSRNLTANLS